MAAKKRKKEKKNVTSDFARALIQNIFCGLKPYSCCCCCVCGKQIKKEEGIEIPLRLRLNLHILFAVEYKKVIHRVAGSTCLGSALLKKAQVSTLPSGLFYYILLRNNFICNLREKNKFVNPSFCLVRQK